jgi:hypothetical protein
VICLTFDTDWMTDETLASFLERVQWPGVGTFFLHADLPCLHGTPHELCPHPFIDDLRSWEAGMEALASSLPVRARGMRAHSCVFSHMVGIRLHELGYRYVSQAHNLFQAGLAPFRHPWGVWEMPIYYMDNMDFWMPKNWPGLAHQPFSTEIINRAMDEPGMYVFDFHPLHIALNTRSHDDYARVKHRIVDEGVSPFDLRFPGRGVGTFFEELCVALERNGQHSRSCSEALEEFSRERG